MFHYRSIVENQYFETSWVTMIQAFTSVITCQNCMYPITPRRNLKDKHDCSPPRVLMLTGVLLCHCPLYQPAGEHCQFINPHVSIRKHKQNQKIATVYLNDLPLLASEKNNSSFGQFFFRFPCVMTLSFFFCSHG